ncbi:DNA gyrase subunit A [Candidatus Xianfuyuplasma coldseepsis]|uniref:DNA gyrase subunit A n=1 Tax=Candidatus Xianfuyuplasma coldseepsis TaxID=2782163 RepID=A0A7L7KQ79_9MOLU|nr:DNA gyrase subunit A [Xianfuyuplasma coldseepsis]QMS84950.1 DNA gyrase subunit A [Xianfuyuplasma coldseepsis]
MEDNNITYDNVKEINISTEMKSSFLSYAMSVIVSRALPDVRDGLKPVHRRILYGMDELGVYPDKSYKKSARIVGDVMGKYHPHGDSSIYDAMVRMAQDFSYRYPLVNGQGNFGSIDGDGAAAMRYTESKMTKITTEMLADIKKDTIDFVENYDGSEKEPSVLPAKYPNLLVNGATGIAVGMATNIPPHNLGEVIDGILAYIDDPDITTDDLMDYIKGPDFPTGGTIMGLTGLRTAYETGNGSIKIRAKTEIKEQKNGKKSIIITEIPFQVNKSRMIEKIADLAKEKRIEGITDLRDESNRNGIRVVIELRKDVNAEVTLNNLYKYTTLQTSFGLNMLALVDNQPQVLPLKDMLVHYVNHQIEVLTRKTNFDLNRAKARAHILEGLLVALDHIDEVIETIRNSYDDAEEQLMTRFELSQDQAKAILEMRLRRLSGLERERLEGELKELLSTIEELEFILANEDQKYELIKQQLLDIKDKYGDERRSEISLSLDLDIEDEDLIPVEDVIITITSSGYCKRMNTEVYKTQNRGGKGMKGIKTNEDDVVEHLISSSTHDFILFFTNTGRVYKMKGYKIPNYGRASKGLPIVNLLNLDDNESLAAVAKISDFESEDFLFFVTKKGVVKRTPVSDFQNIRTTGIKAINLRDGDELLAVRLTDGERDVIIGASNGKAIRFHEQTARAMGRVASGVRGILLADDDEVVGFTIVTDDRTQILVVTENGYGKRTEIDEYRQQNRGGKGVKTLNITDKNGLLTKLRSVCGDEDLIITTTKGMIIRLPIEQIAVSKRATQGVRLIKLNEGHKVATIAIVPPSEDEDDEVVEEMLIEEQVTETENPSQEE